MAAAKLVTATVARGRSVFVGEPDEATGRVTGRKGPGETVSLPADEVKRLTELGFLVDMKADPVVETSGPKATSTDGPSVTTVEN